MCLEEAREVGGPLAPSVGEVVVGKLAGYLPQQVLRDIEGIILTGCGALQAVLEAQRRSSAVVSPPQLHTTLSLSTLLGSSCFISYVYCFNNAQMWAAQVSEMKGGEESGTQPGIAQENKQPLTGKHANKGKTHCGTWDTISNHATYSLETFLDKGKKSQNRDRSSAPDHQLPCYQVRLPSPSHKVCKKPTTVSCSTPQAQPVMPTPSDSDRVLQQYCHNGRDMHAGNGFPPVLSFYR